MVAMIGDKFKKKCIGWLLGQLCDLDREPHQWAWIWNFQVQVLKYILGIVGLIDVKRKWRKSIAY